MTFAYMEDFNIYISELGFAGLGFFPIITPKSNNYGTIKDKYKKRPKILNMLYYFSLLDIFKLNS